VAVIFMAVTGSAMLLGHWQNEIPIEQYQRMHPDIHAFGHPTGGNDIEKLNRDAQEGNASRGPASEGDASD
jgi:hypothetical protein